jgi:hypothetical protein
LRIFLSSTNKLITDLYLDTPRKKRTSDNSLINTCHDDIASKVQTDFVYVFSFVLVYFTKLAVSRTLPKSDRFTFEF